MEVPECVSVVLFFVPYTTLLVLQLFNHLGKLQYIKKTNFYNREIRQWMCLALKGWWSETNIYKSLPCTVAYQKRFVIFPQVCRHRHTPMSCEEVQSELNGRLILMQISFCWFLSFAMSSYLFLPGTHKAWFPHQELTASQSQDKPPREAWPAPAWFMLGKLPHPSRGRSESPGAGLTPCIQFQLATSHLDDPAHTIPLEASVSSSVKWASNNSYLIKVCEA